MRVFILLAHGWPTRSGIPHAGRVIAGSLFLFWLTATAVALIGCAGNEHLERFEFIRVSMGVPAKIIVYSKNKADASSAASAGYARIAQLDECMSDYRPRSELMRLCAQAGGPAVSVSDDLFAVIRRACEISQASDAAFDISVGPMVTLWRTSRHSGTLPDRAELDTLRPIVGWQHIELTERSQTIRLTRPGMKLDLGGIAKGYAAHEAVKVLRSKGESRCLVAMSGDIATGDAPPGTDGWEIEIGMPTTQADTMRPPPRRLLLSNMCVSTSGDTQQFVEIDGVRYSHIVDPRTGLGVTNHTMCTVVATEGSDADAFSSAACVLGAGRAKAMFEMNPRIAALVWTDARVQRSMTIHDPQGRIRFVAGE